MFLSQQVKRNGIITNENGKYELTDELPNNVRFKNSKNLMELQSSVQSTSQNENIVNTSKKLLKLDIELFPYCTANHALFLYGMLHWMKQVKREYLYFTADFKVEPAKMFLRKIC